MVATRQQTRTHSQVHLPFANGSRKTAAAVRWGAAVVDRAPAPGRSARRPALQPRSVTRSRTHAWEGGVGVPASRSRGVVRPAIMRLDTAPAAIRLPAHADVGACAGGAVFTRSRIRYAFELFGACMMIVAFLALAMFA